MSDKILALKYNPVYLFSKRNKMNSTLASGGVIMGEWGCWARASDAMPAGVG